MEDRDRDERAARFETVYRATAPAVYAYCVRRGAHELADDVVDDVYLVAWRRLDEVPPAPLSWLLGVARRALANKRRSQRRQAALVARLEIDTESRPTEESDRAPVLEALRTLREADRELLLLVAWDGLSTREAARVLDCSAVAVRIRLHRARRRLAAALEPSTRAGQPLGVQPKEELQ